MVALVIHCRRSCAAAPVAAAFAVPGPHDSHPLGRSRHHSSPAAAGKLPGRRCVSSPAATRLPALSPRTSQVRPVASPVRPAVSRQVRFYPRNRPVLSDDVPASSRLFRRTRSKEANETAAAFSQQAETRAVPEDAPARIDRGSSEWPTGGWEIGEPEPPRAAVRASAQGATRGLAEAQLEARQAAVRVPVWAEAEPEFLTDENGGDRSVEAKETSRAMEAQVDPTAYVGAEVENEQLETSDGYVRIPAPVLHGRKYLGIVVLPQALQEGQDELLYHFSRPRLKCISRAIANELVARAFVKKRPIELPAEQKKYWTKHKHRNLEKLLDESKLTELQSDEPKAVVALRSASRPKLIPVDYNDEETVLTYVASRMPATYACIFNVLKEIKTRYPSWKPQSVLDYGTGPGTTFWAANELWDIKSFTGVDTSRMMLKAAHMLFKYLPEEILDSKRIELCRKIFEGMVKEQKVDLAVCAFAFERVTSSLEQQKVLRELLEHTEMLVIIERSTPAGFKLIANARAYLLRDNNGIIAKGEDWILRNTADADPGMGGPPRQGFHVVAPCPHDGVCPLVGTPTTCAFSQRLQRPDITRVARAVKRSTADCGYSYVIIRKGLRPRPSPDNTKPDLVREALRWPRLVFPPIKRKGHVILDICSPEGGIHRTTVRKKDGDVAFRCARKSLWGDLVPMVDQAKKVIRDTTKSLLKHKWSSVDR